MSQFYTKGTIKIKNADNVLVPFMPNTTLDNVINNNETLSTTINNLNTRITAAAQKGGIKVMYEEPTTANTSTFSNKTLIGVVPPETWTYTVDTTKLSTTNRITGIPFDLYNVNDTTIVVDWGDENTSTLTKTDYSSQNALISAGYSSLYHIYQQTGIYTVTISSLQFENVKLIDYSGNTINNTSSYYYFKNTITIINKRLPKLARADTTAFNNCTYLDSVPSFTFCENS